MNPDPDSDSKSSPQPARDTARQVESLLWLAAGAAGALVALKALSQSRKLDARRRMFAISERLLKQVFPNGTRL